MLQQNRVINIPNNPAIVKCNAGFTLLELMVVIMIIAIVAAIAFPSYQAYSRKASASAAQQEMQKIAEQLERHKARNFTYKKFDPKVVYSSNPSAPAMTEVITPIGATGSAIKYKITIRDLQEPTKLLTDSTAKGRGWSILAQTQDSLNDNLLMTSEGLRCKSKNSISYSSCGSVSGGW